MLVCNDQAFRHFQQVELHDRGSNQTPSLSSQQAEQHSQIHTFQDNQQQYHIDYILFCIVEVHVKHNHIALSWHATITSIQVTYRHRPIWLSHTQKIEELPRRRPCAAQA